MPILLKCLGCGSQLNAPDSAAGKHVRCPKTGCGRLVPVPAPREGKPRDDEDDEKPRVKRPRDEDEDEDDRDEGKHSRKASAGRASCCPE